MLHIKSLYSIMSITTVSLAVVLCLFLEPASCLPLQHVHIPGCYYNANYYQRGDSWPCVEECYTCSCDYGDLTSENTCIGEESTQSSYYHHVDLSNTTELLYLTPDYLASGH